MKICLSCEGISATDLSHCGSCGTELLAIEAVHYPLRRGEEDAGNPLLGSRIDGKFRITNVLGKGGMGTVFRAVHEVSLVPVALKILHPRYAAQSAYRQGFLAEARKAGRVIHEHSARILDVGEAEDGTVYIAQELVEGDTLDEWIHGGSGLAPATAVEILVQICRALAASHGVGLVHRDLSTRNVMVLLRDERPFVKILDFGIAKGAPVRIEKDEEALGAQATAGFANPAYSAPEQLAGQEADARADLYSLGVIAYEALCRRLPVDGTTGRELARATVEGRLRSMPPRPGVPAELHRLVEGLLSRDPKRRPASAIQVLGILERLQRPRGLLFRRMVVGLMVGAVLLLTLAYAAVTPNPYLRLTQGNSLSLEDRPIVGPAQELKSEELDTLQFDFSGFDPRGLKVEISRSAVSLGEHDLQPEVGEERNQLILSAEQRSFGSLLRTLVEESRGGVPLDLTFRVEGHPPLGYARVLVDDEAPELKLALRGDDRGVVLDTLFDLTLEEFGSLDQLLVRVRSRAGGETLSQIELASPTRGQANELPLGRLLRDDDEFQDASGVHEKLEILLWARDQAGNEGTSRSVDVDYIDLSVPGIQSVSAPEGGRILTYGPERATVRLGLDEVEPELRVRVWDPDGNPQDVIDLESPGGERLDLHLLPSVVETGPPFRDGRYEFQLEDRAGNRSERFSEDLLFRPQQVLPVLSPGNGIGALAVLEGLEVVTDGRPVQLQLQCNEAYQPVAAAVHVGGTPTRVELPEGQTDAYLLDIGSLPDGSHELRLTMRDRSEGAEQDLVIELLVMHSAPTLALPDTRTGRFLPELESLGLLARDADGLLEQGTAWNLGGADLRLLRGELWFGTEESPFRQELGARDPGELLFQGLVPRPGKNTLRLELQDVLGRPVPVLLGDVNAPADGADPGSSVLRVAEFYYEDRDPAPREGEVRVEYDQATRLVIESPLPFAETDEIRLQWSQLPLRAEVAPLANGGTALQFELPFPDLVNATSGLGEVNPEDYADGEGFSFPITLETPAGDHAMRIALRTSRSVLTEVVLQDLAVARELPGALGKVRMVPVLAPTAIFPDPVPTELAARVRYRPAPKIDVRNTQDVYLQRTELTRAQYEAAVQGFLDLDEADREWDSLVHSADPLGAERLTRDGLIPAVHRGAEGRGGETAWLAQLRAADRPVTGINFFQAYTLSRIVGVLVGGDPDLLRLPLGLELEMAALGAPPPSGFALNGLQRSSERGDIVQAHEEAAGHRGDPLEWPPTADESAALGDSTTTGQGFALVGLDFGVREWVLDLPYSAVLEKDALLRSWMADHGGHLNRAMELAREYTPDPALIELEGHVATFGVVRGLALGEPDFLVDGEHGGDLRELRVGPLPSSLPGVVRVLQLRRDGRDLLEDRVDPRLALIGLRLAGGEKFVGEVRAR